MRKRLLALTLSVVLTLLTSLVASAQDTVFPVTVEHKYGSTTIPAAPERVVSLGYTDQDALFALGVQPVAVRLWYGQPLFPWALEAADGAEPVVLDMPFGALNYEEILSLAPDLIIAVDAGITEEEYEFLSQIAPTVPQSGDYINFGMPWQEKTRMIGESVGKLAEAETLIEGIEAQFEAARQQYPSFDGQTISVAYQYGATYGAYTEQDGRARFFTELGFVVPQEMNELAGDQFYSDISAERIDLLDQDLLVFLGLRFTDNGREGIESDPLISTLKAFEEGRVAFIPEEYDDALQFSTVLSLSYALDGIIPVLAEAVGAEPVEVTETFETCGDGGRLFQHALGEACVPAGVERVVALEWTQVEALLALGIQPVGVADIENYNNWLNIPVTLDAGVTDVGTRQEPNLEVIAGLEPDLILAVSFRTGQNYELLSAIAPTLVFDPYPTEGTHYDEMVQTFTTIAEATGRTAEAEIVLTDMTDYFAAAQASLEAAGRAGETFILSQTFAQSDVPTFRLFTQNALAVQVLERIGLTNAWDDAPQQFGFSTVDFEAFAAVEDTNFFYVAQDDYHETLTASPLWEGLPFVQSGRAYWLGGDAWLFGGPLSMRVVVDTVLTTMGVELPLVESETTEVTCEGGLRLVEHNLGTVCIPVDPQRIAAIDIDVVSLMRMLDVKPVAYYGDGYRSWLLSTPEWAGGEAFIEGAIDVGYPGNVELLLAAQPDLIITNSEENYDQLSAIAPTIFFDIYGTDSTQWEDFTRYMGDILNVREEAEALITQTNDRITALGDYYRTQAGEPTTSVVLYGSYGILSGAPYFVYNQIMAQAGIVRPEFQALDNEAYDAANDVYWATLSVEQLPVVDGDVLVMMVSQTEEEIAFAEELTSNMANDPLWGALNAVQTGRFYTVPYQRWISFDPYSVNRIIDDLFTTVVGVDAAEVAPNPFVSVESN
ncbi:MAG: iron-siderophore ABC transporter substrate-binding protein [Anaerolineae bacterium]|nr:iron-siderophore ABC transporter substrate-binding protein [Anaerolineae bacterium]